MAYLPTEVSVELLAECDTTTFAIKFSSAAFELNVYVPQPQVERLRRVSAVSWDAGTLPIGESAGSPVYWCAGEPDAIAIMVGQDDQTWDFSVQVPMTSIDAILREVARLAPLMK